jgi:hypothetical protein
MLVEHRGEVLDAHANRLTLLALPCELLDETVYVDLPHFVDPHAPQDRQHPCERHAVQHPGGLGHVNP